MRPVHGNRLIGRCRRVRKADFTRIDVAGNAAVAQVQLHRGGKHVFTDFLSLYRFPDGWRIVGKIFHAHGN